MLFLVCISSATLLGDVLFVDKTSSLETHPTITSFSSLTFIHFLPLSNDSSLLSLFLSTLSHFLTHSYFVVLPFTTLICTFRTKSSKELLSRNIRYPKRDCIIFGWTVLYNVAVWTWAELQCGSGSPPPKKKQLRSNSSLNSAHNVVLCVYYLNFSLLKCTKSLGGLKWGVRYSILHIYKFKVS